MSTLFIIGNGFDLNHGYKTGYDHFREYLRKNSYTVGTFDLSSLFSDFSESDWKSFEENLCMLDFESWASFFTSDLSGDLSDREFDREYSRNSTLLDMFKEIKEKIFPALCNALCNFIIVATKNKLQSKNYFEENFSNNDYFINFNYTKTLEEIYRIEESRINHIHGIAYSSYMSHDEYEMYDDPCIVFGHGEKTGHPNDDDCDYDEDDFNTFNPEKCLKHLTDRLRKQYQFEDLKNFVENAKKNGITKIEIIGHSLGTVDIPYFELLNNTIDKNVEVVYWIYDEDENKIEKVLKKLFPCHKIEFKYYPR